ncbi:unnamed protein product [Penicillium salamii]|nr:unnamed protein product [Penicillium salamii]CAG8309992.1 unnamed protein product [Penicillium salamii]CAG8418355.1 unnamed protein product [Penicillium salamii]
MPMSLSYINGLSCFPQLLKLNRLLHPLAGLAGGLKNRQDEVDQYFHKNKSTIRDLVMYAYSEGSESGKPSISRVERDTVSDEEWKEFEVEAERPELISDDEGSEDDENSKADTVILESPPTDDPEQDLADKGNNSFLSPPVTWLINSIRRFSDGATVTQ